MNSLSTPDLRLAICNMEIMIPTYFTRLLLRMMTIILAITTGLFIGMRGNPT